QIDLVNAAARSRAIMDGKIRQLCSAEVPGDTQRNLDVQAAFSDQKFKHILVPVWLLTYTYGTKVYQVATNGVTGTIAGGRPWSWVKILLLIIVVLITIIVFNMKR